MFQPEFFQKNRQRLLEQSKAELIVLSAHGLMQESADAPYPFRQNSTFWYVTGLDEPELILVLSPKETFIILPSRPVHMDQWDGAINIEELSKRSGVPRIHSNRDGWAELKRLLTKSKHVHTILEAKPYIPQIQLYTNPAVSRLAQKLKRLQPDISYKSIRESVVELRIVKQEPEIKAIKRAIEITGEALATLQNKQNLLKNEKDVEALLTYEYLHSGAEGHGFEPVIAGGKRAATIHYRANNAPISEQTMLLVDTGAAYDHYRADLTRILSPHRGFSPRQKEVYKAVFEIQAFALKTLKPETTHQTYEQTVREFAGEQLAKLGLIKSSVSKNQRGKLTSQYFPHLTSHQLGIDTHDISGRDEPIRAGMVMTVEPGIYIPEEGIGVRIEDDVLVTKNGNQNLSGHWLPPAKLLQ